MLFDSGNNLVKFAASPAEPSVSNPISDEEELYTVYDSALIASVLNTIRGYLTRTPEEDLQNETNLGPYFNCENNFSTFLGCQPVRLEAQNLNFLSEAAFAVGFIHRARRCLVYVKERDEIYLIDDRNKVYEVCTLDLPWYIFPAPSQPGDILPYHHFQRETLFEGEFYQPPSKVVFSNTKERPIIYITDLIVLHGMRVGYNVSFGNRYELIQHAIIRPICRASTYKYFRMADQSVILQRAPFYIPPFLPPLHTYKSLELGFTPLGFTFCRLGPGTFYQPGRCKNKFQYIFSVPEVVHLKLAVVPPEDRFAQEESYMLGHCSDFLPAIAKIPVKEWDDSVDPNLAYELVPNQGPLGYTFVKVNDTTSTPLALSILDRAACNILPEHILSRLMPTVSDERPPYDPNWPAIQPHKIGVNRVYRIDRTRTKLYAKMRANILRKKREAREAALRAQARALEQVGTPPASPTVPIETTPSAPQASQTTSQTLPRNSGTSLLCCARNARSTE